MAPSPSGSTGRSKHACLIIGAAFRHGLIVPEVGGRDLATLTRYDQQAAVATITSGRGHERGRQLIYLSATVETRAGVNLATNVDEDGDPGLPLDRDRVWLFFPPTLRGHPPNAQKSTDTWCLSSVALMIDTLDDSPRGYRTGDNYCLFAQSWCSMRELQLPSSRPTSLNEAEHVLNYPVDTLWGSELLDIEPARGPAEETDYRSLVRDLLSGRRRPARPLSSAGQDRHRSSTLMARYLPRRPASSG